MLAPVRNERGVALLLTIFGLVVVGGVVTAIFASSLLERRTADSTRRLTKAFNVAERGLSQQVAQWDRQWNQLGVGAAATIPPQTVPFNSGTYAGSILRLNDQLFWIQVTGNDIANGSRQQLGTYMKLIPLDIDVQAAVTTRGAVRVGGSADIDGMDNIPSGWGTCDAPTAGESGIRIDNDDGIEGIGGCGDLSCVAGTPQPIEEDATIDDGTFFDYGELDYNTLASYGIDYPPQTFTSIQPSYNAGPTCNTADLYNWGATGTDNATTDPCASLFRIIHVTGDAQIASSSSGQGILLVDGDLTLTGGFEFFGIVIVRGNFTTTGTGGHIYGGLLAANVDVEQTDVLGNATLNFSTCAIDRALAGIQPGAPLKSRGWVQAY